MSKKRDEMALAATKEKGNLCVEHIIDKYYKQAWDAAIQNDERVLALVAIAEKVSNQIGVIEHDPWTGEALGELTPLAKEAREALTKFKDSVK